MFGDTVMSDIIPPATALVFVIKMSEKHKSASPSAIQVKIDNRQRVLKGS
jgi:hypothetical protein